MSLNFLATVRAKAKDVLANIRSSSHKLMEAMPALTIPFSVETGYYDSAVEAFSSFGNSVDEINDTLRSYANLLTELASDGTIALSTPSGVYLPEINLVPVSGTIDNCALYLKQIADDSATVRKLVCDFHSEGDKLNVTTYVDRLFENGEKYEDLVRDLVQSTSVNEMVDLAMSKAIDTFSSSRANPDTYLDVANTFMSEQADKFPNRSDDLNNAAEILKAGLSGGLESTLSTVRTLFNTLRHLRNQNKGYTFIDNNQFNVNSFASGLVNFIGGMLNTIANVLLVIGGFALKMIATIGKVLLNVFNKVKGYFSSDEYAAGYIHFNTQDPGYYDYPYGIAQGVIPNEVLQAILAEEPNWVDTLEEKGSISLQYPGCHFILVYDNASGESITSTSVINYAIKANALCDKSPWEVSDWGPYSSSLTLAYTPDASHPQSDVSGGILSVSTTNNTYQYMIQTFLRGYSSQLTNPLDYQVGTLVEVDAIHRKRMMNAMAWFALWCCCEKILHYGVRTYSYSVSFTTNIGYSGDVPNPTEDCTFWLPLIRCKTNYWNNAETSISSVFDSKNWDCWWFDGKVLYNQNDRDSISLLPFIQQRADLADGRDFIDPTSQSCCWFLPLGFSDIPLSHIYVNDQVSDDDQGLSFTDEFDSFGDELFKIPTYRAGDVVSTMWRIVGVCAILATAAIISTVLVKKSIRKARVRKAAAAEQAWADFIKKPNDPDLYAKYQAAARSNNKFVKIFGGTSYSREGFWASDTADSNDSTLLGNSIIYQAVTGRFQPS